MTQIDRFAIATRAFSLATVLGLALAFPRPLVAQTVLLLLVLGALATAAMQFSFVNVRWICTVEGVLASVAIGLTLPLGATLLPYLMAPAILVGLVGKIRSVILVVGGESLALIAVLLLGGTGVDVSAGLELGAPWVVASLGAGLMTAWVSRLRSSPARTDEASYESARRLLSQLRTVARRLSSGLDPVSMAEQVLVVTHHSLDDTQSALFVRTEGGVLSPLGYRGHAAKQALVPDGELVDRCWTEMEPAQGPGAAGSADRGHRVVLPLRSGSRMIGVVISDCAVAPSSAAVVELMRELDEQAVRLDTALVFDEVRQLATMEERQRLAREIHDGVAQEIASLGYFVDDLSAGSISESQRAKLQSLRSEISRVVSELRLSIFDLRSEISPAAGLGSALSDYVRAVGARSGLTVHLTLDEAPTRLRGEIETELLRIAQEAVTNARKHSDAENLWVDCRIRPPFACITVQDDGGGLGQPRPDSYGLKIMRERADRISASLEIGERDLTEGVRGTRVAVTVGDDVLTAR